MYFLVVDDSLNVPLSGLYIFRHIILTSFGIFNVFILVINHFIVFISENVACTNIMHHNLEHSKFETIILKKISGRLGIIICYILGACINKHTYIQEAVQVDVKYEFHCINHSHDTKEIVSIENVIPMSCFINNLIYTYMPKKLDLKGCNFFFFFDFCLTRV